MLHRLGSVSDAKGYEPKWNADGELLAYPTDRRKAEPATEVLLNQSDVQQYFPSSYTPQQMQNVIISLLRNWEHKRSSRQRPQHEEELER